MSNSTTVTFSNNTPPTLTVGTVNNQTLNWSSQKPANPVEGQAYFDNYTRQSYVFTNGAWSLISSAGPITVGSGINSIEEQEFITVKFRNRDLKVPKDSNETFIQQLFIVDKLGYEYIKFFNQFQSTPVNDHIKEIFLILLETEENQEYRFEMEEYLLSNV